MTRYILEDFGHVTPCWSWNGYRLPTGYGRLTSRGRQVLAHRHFYEQANGAIPAGLEIDHLCRNRACVRPDHLEAVTRAENVQRSGLARRTASVEQLRALRQRGLLLREIAAVVGLSVSRVCTLLKESAA